MFLLMFVSSIRFWDMNPVEWDIGQILVAKVYFLVRNRIYIKKNDFFLNLKF